MNPAAARTSASPPMVFRDAFGERRRIAAPTGSETLDVLCLRSELTAVPSFEFALRERVSRLTGFRHPNFAQVRTVERLGDPARTLALISNSTPGVRLSDLLTTTAKHDDLVLDGDAALCLVRQLVNAIAALHEQAPDAAHGALGPERIIVTPNAKLIVVEHVMGSAVEQLQYSEDRYWRELRVPCPRSIGMTAFDQRTDAFQVGVVALALLLRRPLQADELTHVQDVVAAARSMSTAGEARSLPSGFRPWLMAALQLDQHMVFGSAIDARAEIEQVFALSDNVGGTAALEAFLARYLERTEPAGEPAVATRPPTPPPAPAAPPLEPPVHHVALEPEPVIQQPMVQPPVAQPAAYTSPSLALRAETTAVQAFASETTPEPPQPSRSSAPDFSSRFEPSRPPTGRVAPVHASEETMDMPSNARKRGGARAALVAVALLLVVGGGTLAARMFFGGGGATTGTVAVTTNPPGAQVLLNGEPQGISPTTLTVPPGAHLLELRGAGEPRTIPIEVTAGAQLSQYIELGKGPTTLGNLQVRTEPPGGRISVDGVPIGPSPVTVVDLQPGEHTVVVETEGGSTRQTVIVEAGATASLVAQLPVATQSGPASGWISVTTPRTVQLFEDGRLIGSSDTERLMVPTGTHRLEIVNEALGYRDTHTVQVTAGKVSPINIEFPKGTIALNAVPWADVWIDGEKVGETPIGNLPVTIGSHEIIFRHPEFGEQRHVTTVTLNGPARLSVDMRKRP